MKRKAWGTKARKVSATSAVARTADKCRAKWQDYQSRIKTKKVEQKKEKRRTGGGPPPPDLKPIEETVLDIIGKTATEGIERGLDTAVSAPAEITFPEDGSMMSPIESTDLVSASSSQNDLSEEEVLEVSEESEAFQRGAAAKVQISPGVISSTPFTVKRGSDKSAARSKPLDDHVDNKWSPTPSVDQLYTSNPSVKSSVKRGTAAESTPITSQKNPQYSSILEIENERLRIEKERLEIEKETLGVLRTISQSLTTMVEYRPNIGQSGGTNIPDEINIPAERTIPAERNMPNDANVSVASWNWNSEMSTSSHYLAATQCYLNTDN